MEKETQHKFKVRSFAWLQIQGVFKRELVVIEEQMIGTGGMYVYRVSYATGPARDTQSIVTEGELGEYYG